MNLRKYFAKKVKIDFTDGDVMTAIVEAYIPAIDNEDGLEEIAVKPRPTYPGLISITEDEIKSIEIIE